MACPVCGVSVGGVGALAEHLVVAAAASDGHHIMWLNRNVTKQRTTAALLEPLLAVALAGGEPGGERVKR